MTPLTSLIHEKRNSAILTIYFLNGKYYINDYEGFSDAMKKLNDPVSFFKKDNNRAGWFHINYMELYEMYKELTILLLPSGILSQTIWIETMMFFYVLKSRTKQINYANLFDESGNYLWV